MNCRVCVHVRWIAVYVCMLDANLKWAEQRNIHFPSCAADGRGLLFSKQLFPHIELLHPRPFFTVSSSTMESWAIELSGGWALSKFSKRLRFDLSQQHISPGSPQTPPYLQLTTLQWNIAKLWKSRWALSKLSKLFHLFTFLTTTTSSKLFQIIILLFNCCSSQQDSRLLNLISQSPTLLFQISLHLN